MCVWENCVGFVFKSLILQNREGAFVLLWILAEHRIEKNIKQYISKKYLEKPRTFF